MSNIVIIILQLAENLKILKHKDLWFKKIIFYAINQNIKNIFIAGFF